MFVYSYRIFFVGIFIWLIVLQITDDIQASVSAIATEVQEICRSFILATEANPTNEGTPDDPVLVLEELERLVCPGECSGNGQCQDGICQCDAGKCFQCCWHYLNFTVRIVQLKCLYFKMLDNLNPFKKVKPMPAMQKINILLNSNENLAI